MFFRFGDSNPPPDFTKLSYEELMQEFASWPQRMKAKFDADPVEGRLKFAEDFRKKLDEWKGTLNPTLRTELLDIVAEIEAEAALHGTAIWADSLMADLAVWEKQENPPMREIIRVQNEAVEILGAMDALPDYARAGATKDIQELVQRLEKLQA